MTMTKHQNVNTCLACGNDVDEELRCPYCEPSEDEIDDLYLTAGIAADRVCELDEILGCQAYRRERMVFLYEREHKRKLRDYLVKLIQKQDPTFLTRSHAA